MKVMTDTNIIISALLFPSSLPANVLLYIASNHNLVLCDHIIAETRDVIERKRPDLSGDFDVLLAQLACELIIAPKEPSKLMHDPKDQPILNAAIIAGVDIIVSGDKHFLELELDRPKMMSPSKFWRIFTTT